MRIDRGTWCLACAKCAFVALSVTAVDRTLPARIWGEYVLDRPELLPHLEALIHDAIDKPFECVGTLEECRIAGYLLLKNQPDLINKR